MNQILIEYLILLRMNFDTVSKFEKEIASFYGAPYAVAVDCCTHALELCLRYRNVKEINVPRRTYISIPFLSKKLNIKLNWTDNQWEDYYHLNDEIIDAAVLWKKNSYIQDKFMCISFQFRKHLNLGRGGVILLTNTEDYNKLKKMSYDGRVQDIPWRDQNIESIGYHYYMTPETAQNGLNKLPEAINQKPKKWKFTDWPDVSKMKVFK
jgi:dTDP-4-amino-4,6-dideoxygalactose transaminase